MLKKYRAFYLKTKGSFFFNQELYNHANHQSTMRRENKIFDEGFESLLSELHFLHPLGGHVSMYSKKHKEKNIVSENIVSVTPI